MSGSCDPPFGREPRHATRAAVERMQVSGRDQRRGGGSSWSKTTNVGVTPAVGTEIAHSARSPLAVCLADLAKRWEGVGVLNRVD